MNEERKSVKAKGYEHLYDVSRSGRIINKKTNIVKKLYGNEYGFENVHLFKNGKRELFKTFELWEEVYGEVALESEYKGMK